LETLYLKKEICSEEFDSWYQTNGRLGKKHDFASRVVQMDRIGEEIETLNNRIEVLENRKKKVISVIDRFQGLEQRILKMKYINNMTLKEIAVELGYADQYIRNKHAELMKRIKFGGNE